MITICIPAYRAGGFIGATVESVLAQDFDDFILRIAIDPAEGEDGATLKSLAPYRDDPRVSVFSNRQRLGWAGNLHALLDGVRTELFAPLPHDDLWRSNYLSTFVPMMKANPLASVAYGDLTYIGARPSWLRKSVKLPQGESRLDHLLRFMVQGAQAMPWRGVTRREALKITQGFPQDRFGGFAVECEYALGLLEAGPVLHVPEPLYQKRIFDDTARVSASRARLLQLDAADKLRAWSCHRNALQIRLRRMLAAYAASQEETSLVQDAFAAAMLDRRARLADLGLTASEVTALQASLTRAERSTHKLAPLVAKRIAEDIARHGRQMSG